LLNSQNLDFRLGAQGPAVVVPINNRENILNKHWVVHSDASDVKKLAAAQQFIDEELRDVKDRILRADAALVSLGGA
jgi:hypothetical protein